jgi:hypothetical protein
MIKKNGFLFFFFLFMTISCKKVIVSKPEKYLDENTITNILYDLALLEAIQAVNPPEYDVSSIRPLDFVYEKYSIDSAVLYQNNAYYAANPERYAQIHQKIAERLALIEIEKDTLISIEKQNLQKNILTKVISDAVDIGN